MKLILIKYDPYLDKFTAFYCITDNENTISSDFIFHHNSLMLDEEGFLWIGTDNGFYHNDRRVQLKGVKLHHDHGPPGAAFYIRAMERQLEIMKSMGCNAIRTSHNVPAPKYSNYVIKWGYLFLMKFLINRIKKLILQKKLILKSLHIVMWKILF